jgi:GntR family transcriptional repressor for pyruvate dehydrogenase complex
MKPLNRIPLVDQVVDSLILHIKSDEIQEGSKLPSENSLCESLAVGRGTVREALRILSTRGYISLIPSRGAFVASKEPTLHKWFQVNELEIRNVLEVRNAIEPLAISLAIEACTEEEITKLQKNLEEAKDLLANKNYEKLSVNDEEFHALIALISKNSLLISINKDIENCLHEFRLRTFLIENNRSNFYPAHKEIVDAFVARDVRQGEKSMLKHLSMVHHDMEKSMLA